MKQHRSSHALAVRLLMLVTLPASGRLLRAEDAPPTYEQHVLPIFKEKCCGCHNAGKKAGGLDLTSYQQMQAGGNSGEVLAAGDPDGSYLWQVASHESEPVMPPNADRIPDSMLEVIRKWIIGGLIERDGAKPMATTPAANLALDPGAIVTPEGDPVLPPRLSLRVVTHGIRPTTVTALAASPHGDVVAIGGRRQVLLFSPASRQLLGVLPFPEGDCQTLRFSRNARLLLGGGGVAAKSGSVVLWDVASGERLITLGDEYDEVLTADLSADQRLVALGGSAKVVRLLTTADGQVESEITKHTDWITSVAFSPDSVLLATGDRAGNLFLWESFGAREWAVLKGHSDRITAISWRADGLLLATSAEDGTIHLWDADQGKKVRSWKAHGDGTSDVQWLKDGRLVSTGRDRNVKLWKADGKLERDFGDLSDIGTRVVVNDAQSLVIAADWAGQVEVFGLTDGKRIGEIDTNPKPLEERLAESMQKLAEGQEQERVKAAALRSQEADAGKKIAEAEKQLAAAKEQLQEAARALVATEQREREADRLLAEADRRLKNSSSGTSDSERPEDAPSSGERASQQTAGGEGDGVPDGEVVAKARRRALMLKKKAEEAKQVELKAKAEAQAAVKGAEKELQVRQADASEKTQRCRQALSQATQHVAKIKDEVKRWKLEISFAKEVESAQRSP